MDKSKYTITCSIVAIEKARERITKRNNPDTKGIRIGLVAGGCNGFSLLMEFVDSINDKDHIFTFGDISIFVDPKSIILLNETNIDYEHSLMHSGFKFNIPSQKGSCSCGNSIII